MHFPIRHLKQLLLPILLTISIFYEAESQEYFQQEVNYKIAVTLDDRSNELSAFETIQYTNHSPDTLRFIYFHLWPNGYSNNQTALAKQLFLQKGKERLFKNPELQGYIDSLNFKIDGSKVIWESLPDFPDICKVLLNNPLNPNSTILISTPFHVKIPKGVTSRLGHIGESYQISQWYPKPAVYDQSGWHEMPYLDQGEFYAEFGNFDVSITLPDNYIVGATGNLQNQEEIKFLDTLAKDTSWMQVPISKLNPFPASSKRTKTLQFKENNIHDFAWFADKRFHVLKGSVKLPQSGRSITTWVMFTSQQSDYWKKSIPYLNQAILYFSGLIGDYPYNNVTAVQSALNAGSGMEYPGITVIGVVKDDYALDGVIAHEIGHNWFYSALGTNERRYPFMDEGITSLYEKRYMNYSYPGKKLWEVYLKNKKLAKFLHIENLPVQRMIELQWLTIARRGLEQPVNLKATDYNTNNYAMLVYDKAAMGFNYLRADLGDSLFDATMRDYYKIWKFKHPQPEDLRQLFELHSGKDLSWFFIDFLGTTKRVDYKISGIRNNQLLLSNKGNIASPVVISGLRGDSILFEKWYDGFMGKSKINLPSGNYTEFRIDPRHSMTEVYRLNNNYHTKGLFRKWDPVHTQFYFSIEDPDKRTVMYMPSVNWNHENGIMVGVTLHNGFLVPKPFEYFLMPFYVVNQPDLAGYGKIAYNITPFGKFFRLITVSLEGTQYRTPGDQNYHKVKAGFELYFKTKRINPDFRQKIYSYFISASDLLKIEQLKKANMTSYLQFGYLFEKTGLINPYDLSAFLEAGKAYRKISAEFNYRFSYYGKNSGLDLRLYAGTMLKNSMEIPFYNLSPSARTGRELYLFQGNYANRFGEFPKTFGSRQMSLTEGGLVSDINGLSGYSKWLISISITSNLPSKAGRIPIKPFANILFNDHGLDTNHSFPVFFEAGLKGGLWKFFEVYVPLIVSDNIGSMNGSVKDRIRFTLNLGMLNQFKLNSNNVK